MKKFLSVGLVSLLALSLMLTGCGSQASNSTASSGSSGDIKAVTLRLGHNSHEASVTNLALKNWAKTVSDKTNGKLKIDIFPQNALGTNKELSEQTALGSLDMNVQGLSALVEYGVEEGYLAKVPFLFKNLNVAIQFWQGDQGKLLMQKAENKGVKVLSAGINRMPRQMASKTKPINSPEDIKGLKIRAGDTATNSTLKVLGAIPTNIALNEMYTAVSQGMVDVVELPLDYINDYAMNEVCKYLTLTNHTYDLQYLVVSKKSFESLSPEYQKVLAETIPAMEKENNNAMEVQFNDVLKKLKDKGMTIIETDRSKWESIVPKLVPELEKTWPSTKGYYDKILNMK